MGGCTYRFNSSLSKTKHRKIISKGKDKTAFKGYFYKTKWVLVAVILYVLLFLMLSAQKE